MDRANAMDAAKGAIAGAVGVWLMDQVTWGMYLREASQALRQEQEARVWGKDVAHVAAEKLVGAIGLERPSAQPHPAGIVVHYALGVVPGALYAPLRRRVKALGAGRGLLYGLGLTIVNDEVLAPALGLASGAARYPWQAHARGLVGHLVLGAATDTVLDVLDRVK
ncbi:MAG: DUF1440 domain-containing protein [Actinomycetota bacterium]|nr:DUF1440 domain-containing protein [Actinomycetota bacterium]